MHGHEDSLDLTEGFSEPRGPQAAAPVGRPYLRLYFRCANVYTRAYLNAAGDGYTGRCSACGKCINFRIGPGGTSERFFEVSC